MSQGKTGRPCRLLALAATVIGFSISLAGSPAGGSETRQVPEQIAARVLGLCPSSSSLDNHSGQQSGLNGTLDFGTFSCAGAPFNC